MEIWAHSKERGMSRVWAKSPFGGRREEAGLPVLSLRLPWRCTLRSDCSQGTVSLPAPEAGSWGPVVPCAHPFAVMLWEMLEMQQFTDAL